MSIVKRKLYRCTRCKYKWMSAVTPTVCAKCHSPYYNRPKKNRKRVNGVRDEIVYRDGDKVEIIETRPISKDKHFKVIK